MPIETGVWKIVDTGLSEMQTTTLKSEAQLHQWIKENPRLISSDLLLIGSEVTTSHGGRIDLLGIDSAGTLHVIELKRDKTPREVVAQALDYASWAVKLSSEDLDRLCRDYCNVDLETAYRDRFGASIPGTLNADHSIMIVASALDPSSERIVQYLSEYHDLNINAVFFTIFGDGDAKVLTRSTLLDPGKVSARSEQRADRKEPSAWTGYYFVNIGIDEGRSWDDDRRFGIVSAGGGVRWRGFMQKLQTGDRIFAYAKSRGYVGYGVVAKPAVMAKDFRLENGESLLAQELRGPRLRSSPDDEELGEYVVAIDWKAVVELDGAKTRPGIFRIQQVVNKIYDSATVDFLTDQFGVANLGAR